MAPPEPPRRGPRRPPTPAGRAPSPGAPSRERRARTAASTTPATSSTVRGLADASRSGRAAGRHERRPARSTVVRNRAIAGVVFVGVLLAGAVTVSALTGDDDPDTTATGDRAAATATTAADDEGDGEGDGGLDAGPQTPPGLAPAAFADHDAWVDPASSGQPWSSEVLGQLTFRGNPTRSYHGLGPVPSAPEIQWRFPATGGMCGMSSVGGESKQWCGTGWTGQPSVWVDDDRTVVGFGAYDKNVHFLDATDGTEVIGPYGIGDIVKGSVTRDPDGFPLLYSGSRADFHVIATDRDSGAAESLWSMSADNVSPTKWNDDWDSSPLVVDDYLFQGGENSWFYIIKLNRAMGDDGKVTVDPDIVFTAPGWDDQLLADLAGSGSRVNDVSIENSLAISGDTLYFSNSGGLAQGWDISGVKEGRDPERIFRFWTGDDTDASIVIDEEGFLYVAQQVERASTSERSTEVGQLVKLDPRNPEDPIVWSVADARGIWATPAISDGVVVAPTDSGRIIGADRRTGEILWEKDLPGPTWSSPVIVDGVWIQGDCAGTLHGFDFSDPRVEPPELWTVDLEGCIESTPTVFQGQIFVGARGGAFYAIGDAADG